MMTEAEEAPFVSVIIVNYNAGDRLAKCLRHLHEQTFRSFETIIIDNASTDNSISLAQDTGVPFTLVEAGSNLGFAAGNNKAAELARSKWIALLNPDAYAEADWLEVFADATAEYPWADAFGSTQLSAEDPDTLDGSGDACTAFGFAYRGGLGWPAADVGADSECFAPCAAAAFYRRSSFESLSGFDERFFCYCEDVDLGYRLRLSGGRIVQLSKARVHHEGSAITGRKSEFTTYHGHRNRIWLYYKNTPFLLYALTLPLRLVADIALGLRFSFSGLGRTYARALMDGYGGLKDFKADRASWAGRGRSAEFAPLLVWLPWVISSRRAKPLPLKAPSVS